MLAYSSIAQAGFMLIALFSLNDYAGKGLLMYSCSLLPGDYRFVCCLG
jgi:NADH-quinone oxidoreductase subunit N